MARHFENWLSAFAEYTQESEAPSLFHFWTGVFTIARALRRQVWIEQKLFQWTPNFYIVLVGPAGVVTKSTSLRLGTNLLSKIDGIAFGPKSMTWQGLTDALAESQALVPFINELTGEEEYRSMSCITCAVNELGTFLRPDDKEMTDVLTDLWDGQLEIWDRRTKGLEGRVSIENPWINLMGCTTPAWLQTNFTEAMVGGGLASRIVFVFADAKRHLVAYPSDAIHDDTFDALETKLVEDLELISQIKGEYKLTAAAKKWGRDWYKEHWTVRPDHMASDRFGGYIARKQTHIHKLAIVLAAAQRKNLIITDDDLKFAAHMVTSLEDSMQRVFESIGTGENSKNLNEMLAYVRAYKSIPQKELYRLLYNIMTTKDFEEATNSGVKAGLLRVTNEKGDLCYTPIYPKQPDEKGS